MNIQEAKTEICNTLRAYLAKDENGYYTYPLIRQEKERKELKNLRALIYFTDGDGIYPGQKPDYETAFVFLKRTDKIKLVPPWAKCLITGTGQTAEQMSV